MTDEVRQTIIAGVLAEVGDRSVSDLERTQDEDLVRLLQALDV